MGDTLFFIACQLAASTVLVLILAGLWFIFLS